MLSQFFALVLVNTYSWFGGQGYCAFDFALTESGTEYRKVEIVLRPIFDPQSTATGRTSLDDQIISLDVIGGSHVNWADSAKVETDCTVTGFDIVSARALEAGKRVDLLASKAISIETYEPVEMRLSGKSK